VGFPKLVFETGMGFKRTYTEWEPHMEEWLHSCSRWRIITPDDHHAIMEAIRTGDNSRIRARRSGQSGLLGTGTPQVMKQILMKWQAYYKMQFLWEYNSVQEDPQFDWWKWEYPPYQWPHTLWDRKDCCDVATTDESAALGLWDGERLGRAGEGYEEHKDGYECEWHPPIDWAWDARGWWRCRKCWRVWDRECQQYRCFREPAQVHRECRVFTKDVDEDHPECTRDRDLCCPRMCGHNLWRHFLPPPPGLHAEEESSPPPRPFTYGPPSAEALAADPALAREDRYIIPYADAERVDCDPTDWSLALFNKTHWTNWYEFDFDDSFCAVVWEPHPNLRAAYLADSVKNWVDWKLRAWIARTRRNYTPCISYEDIQWRYPHWFGFPNSQVWRRMLGPGGELVRIPSLFPQPPGTPKTPLEELREQAHKRFVTSRLALSKGRFVQKWQPGTDGRFEIEEHVVLSPGASLTEAEKQFRDHDWVPWVHDPTEADPHHRSRVVRKIYQVFDTLPAGTIPSVMTAPHLQVQTNGSWRGWEKDHQEDMDPEARRSEHGPGPHLFRQEDGSVVLQDGNRPMGIGYPSLGQKLKRPLEELPRSQSLEEWHSQTQWWMMAPTEEEWATLSNKKLKERHWMYFEDKGTEFQQRLARGDYVGCCEVAPVREPPGGDRWGKAWMYCVERDCAGNVVKEHWFEMRHVEAHPEQFYTKQDGPLQSQPPAKRRKLGRREQRSTWTRFGKQVDPLERDRRLDPDEGDVRRRDWAEEVDDVLARVREMIDIDWLPAATWETCHKRAFDEALSVFQLNDSGRSQAMKELHLLSLDMWLRWPAGRLAETHFPPGRMGSLRHFRASPDEAEQKTVIKTRNWGWRAKRHFQVMLGYDAMWWEPTCLHHQQSWVKEQLLAFFKPRLRERSQADQSAAGYLLRSLREDLFTSNWQMEKDSRWQALPEFAGGPTHKREEVDASFFGGAPWWRIPLSGIPLEEDMAHNPGVQMDCGYNSDWADQKCRCRVFHGTHVQFVGAMVDSGSPHASVAGETGMRATYGTGLYTHWSYESWKCAMYAEAADVSKNLMFLRTIFEGRALCHGRCPQSTHGSKQRMYNPSCVQWAALWVQWSHVSELQDNTLVADHYDPRLDLAPSEARASATQERAEVAPEMVQAWEEVEEEANYLSD